MTLSTLEVLHTARDRIANKRMTWNFTDFTACTCGHIYAAANGRRAGHSSDVFRGLTGQYRDIMRATARSLGYQGEDYDAAVWFVSDRTADVSDDRGEDHVMREDALSVIDRAIAAIEAEEQRNRLDVLAQTRAIVDAAPAEVAA